MKRTLVQKIAAHPEERVSLLPQVEEGFPVTEFGALRKTFAVTDADLAPKLGMSIPTLHRRREKMRGSIPRRATKSCAVRRGAGIL